MQYLTRISSALLLCSSFLLAAPAYAQQSAQDRAASLRAQLAEVEAKQSESQMRMQQLEEALKPENIESSLAGVGSTHPEDLRAQRRRQLENEKAGVSAQLDQLAISHRRLETAIAEAEAAAYHQSARPNDPGANIKGPQTASVDDSRTKTKRTTRHRPRKVKAKRSR
jgi:septal ring factor EnvC (AmiA/AmiB activator)